MSYITYIFYLEKPKPSFFPPKVVENFVHNFSSENFNEKQLNILNYGLNFAIEPKSDEVIEVTIVDIETGIQYMQDSSQHFIRSSSSRLLKTYNRNEHSSEIHTKEQHKIIERERLYLLKSRKGL